MTLTIRAHFDGKVIVPDEELDLPVDAPLEVELRTLLPELPPAALSLQERLQRLASASGRLSGPAIPLEALRRENLYEERG